MNKKKGSHRVPSLSPQMLPMEVASFHAVDPPSENKNYYIANSLNCTKHASLAIAWSRRLGGIKSQIEEVLLLEKIFFGIQRENKRAYARRGKMGLERRYLLASLADLRRDLSSNVGKRFCFLMEKNNN